MTRSAARFHLALACAYRVFRLLTPGSPGKRLATIWDLEGAEPVADARAA
ncbi:MAG: hypothetical protein MO846_12115 [Candidatus Devosia symbiotica]|nr:hypothetical protein [Candidatus Devosia symbiotica]